MKTNLVYYSNSTYGYLENSKVIKYEDNKVFDALALRIGKKDYRRQVFSLGLGIFCFLIVLALGILSILKIIDIGLFVFTFVVAGGVLLWTILYYLCGFIFYSKEHINIFFKNNKSNNPESLVYYATSDYKKWFDKYFDDVSKACFLEANTNKQIVFGKALKFKIKNNLFFNGKITSNIPYYFISYNNIRFIFMPGFIIYVNGHKSKIITNDKFNVTYIDNIYSFIIDNTKVLSFKSLDIFNINFFYFKY